MVLLASDNGATRPLIGAQLADHGYRIVETSTVEQTLVAAHDGVEVIVIDNGSRGINGWEMLPQLRRASPESHTPLIVLSLDTQQAPVEGLCNGMISRPVNAQAMIAEVVRVLGVASELARILVVEESEPMARLVAEIFSGENGTVKITRSREQATEECLSFQPHLVVLNIGMSGAEGFNLVDWLRQQESLTRLVLVLYSTRGLNVAGTGPPPMEPTTFLRRARVQPEILEALLLTILRGGRQIEAEVEVPDVSGVRA